MLTQRLLHTDAFTHKRFNTRTLLHTEAFTHRLLYTQTTLSNTDAFTHRSFYTQTLLHTNAFTHRRFYTQRHLHTEAFTQRLLHTQTLLHTEAFTHRRFYTQRLLHTEAFTHKRFYTQTLLHTDAFTHRRFYFYTQTLLRADAFTHTLSHTLTFTYRDRTREIAILPQFLAIEPHFACKGCDWHLKIFILPQFLPVFLVSCSSRPLSEHTAHEASTPLERWPSTWSLPVAQQAVQFHTWSASAGTWKHPTKKLKQHPRRQQSPTNKLPAPWCHTSRLPQACLSLHERDGTLEIMKGHQNCLLQTTAAQYSKKPLSKAFQNRRCLKKSPFVTSSCTWAATTCICSRMRCTALSLGEATWQRIMPVLPPVTSHSFMLRATGTSPT